MEYLAILMRSLCWERLKQRQTEHKRLWKGTKPNERFFLPPLSPLYRAASSCGGSRRLWERWQHLPAELTMRKGVWPQCWVCPSTMAAMSPGQGHWGQPAWNESRVKMAGKWQWATLSNILENVVCEREDLEGINGRWRGCEARSQREARWQAGGSSPPLLIASNGQQDQAGQDENEDDCCVSASGQQGQADDGKGSRSQIWITLDDEQSRGSPSRNNWLLMVILSGVGSLSGDKQMIEGQAAYYLQSWRAIQYQSRPHSSIDQLCRCKYWTQRWEFSHP